MGNLVNGKWLSDEEYDYFLQSEYDRLVKEGVIQELEKQVYKNDYQIDLDSDY
jgi:hypothetical protein